jgi:Carboxypeptidase regulatory-like domain
LAALAMTPAAFGQQGPVSSLRPGTSSISGVLVDGRSKQPISGCRVGLVEVQVRVPRNALAITDADGRYAFDGIAGGEYAINTLCESHVTSCYRSPGTEPPRCDTVSVVTDQRKTNIDLTLTPGATARGRVVDARGRPFSGATVRLGWPVRAAGAVMHSPTRTNREGLFELSNLPEGEWRLEVELPADAGSARPPVVYFPGVLAQSEAGSIELVAGEIHDNIVVVAPRLSDNRLTVRIVTAEQNLTQLDVSLVRTEPLSSRRVTIDGSGTGTIDGVAPGRYFLTARGWTGDRVWTAADALEFAGDSQEVLLYLQPAARLRGRIVADRGAAPSMDSARMAATWTHDGIAINPLAFDEAPVAPDGTFRLDGLFGSCQLQLIGFDPAFEILSISQGRSDVTASGVALTPGAESSVVVVVRRR